MYFLLTFFLNDKNKMFTYRKEIETVRKKVFTAKENMILKIRFK